MDWKDLTYVALAERLHGLGWGIMKWTKNLKKSNKMWKNVKNVVLNQVFLSNLAKNFTKSSL